MKIHLEKSTFQTQRSQERLGCVKSESNALHKSATTGLLQLRLCIGCAIRSLLPCLGFPHRTSCLIPCYDPTHERRKDLETPTTQSWHGKRSSNVLITAQSDFPKLGSLSLFCVDANTSSLTGVAVATQPQHEQLLLNRSAPPQARLSTRSECFRAVLPVTS